MDSQLGHLVYAGFVRQTPARRLMQLQRFLHGAEARMDKLSQAPDKDRQLQTEIEPWWQRCIAIIDRADNDWRGNSAFQEYRWMVEEYRMSLFAQNLGAAIKISAKRLEAQWKQTHIEAPGRRVNIPA